VGEREVELGADFSFYCLAKRGRRVVYPKRVAEVVTRTLHLRDMHIWAAALRDIESLLDEAK